MKKSEDEINNQITYVTANHSNEDIMVINIPGEMEAELVEQMTDDIVRKITS